MSGIRFGLDRLLSDPALRQPLVGKRVALLARQHRREKPHDLGVSIECGKRLQVLLPPLAQYDLHAANESDTPDLPPTKTAPDASPPPSPTRPSRPHLVRDAPSMRENLA